MLENKVNVDLATSANATPMDDANKEDSVVVAITRDSRVYLGQNQISIANLGSQRFAMIWKTKPARSSTSAPMPAAHYGTVMDAIDAVRTAGVEEVGMLTEQQQPARQRPGPQPLQAASNTVFAAEV
jgi:biopolymer transport protein TolR